MAVPGRAMNESDLELIRRFRNGNQEGFDEIYGRYAKRVYGWHRRRGHDHGNAEDLAQLTMIKLYKKLLKAQEPEHESIAALLVAMSRDVERDERKRAKAPWEPLPAEIVDPMATPRSNNVIDVVQAAVATISPKNQTVLLAIVGGWTAKEIASMTHSTVSAVKARIQRGRSALAAYLQAEWKGTNHDLDG